MKCLFCRKNDKRQGFWPFCGPICERRYAQARKIGLI